MHKPNRQASTFPRRRPSGIGASAFAIVATGSLVLAGCGRSAPVDALADPSNDPDIAGVSITSPDAVVATEPTTPGEAVVDETPSSPLQPSAGVTYEVQPGDTLSVIADSYNITIQALADANGIVDVNSIAPGQQLIIPAAPVEVTVVDTATSTTQP